MNVGIANKLSVKLGLILNKVLGKNSPVTNIIKVDMMVCINTNRNSLLMKLANNCCSINSAINIPYITNAILFPTNMVEIKLLGLW